MIPLEIKKSILCTYDFTFLIFNQGSMVIEMKKV